MTEPTFPLTFTGPWNEWQRVAPDGAVVRIREVSAHTESGWRMRGMTRYSISVNGRRVDSFLTFEAALRKAKALAQAMYPAPPVAEPAEMPDAPWRQIHG